MSTHSRRFRDERTPPGRPATGALSVRFRALLPIGAWTLACVLLTAENRPCRGADPLDAQNVVWTTPSKDSSGSMPIGNGDIGLNVWAEENGDILFYIGKTDAWDEQARLLKLGRVRLRFTPSLAGTSFRQELRLREGEIRIVSGPTQSPIGIRLWVDANHPVIRVEAEGKAPFTMRADLEIWRTGMRPLTGAEAHGVDGLGKAQSPFVYPDTVIEAPGDQIVWYHRNQFSIWPTTLRLQGLDSWGSGASDPLLHRTFGGSIEGRGFTRTQSTTLESESPQRRFELRIPVHAASTSRAEDWLTGLKKLQSQLDAEPLEASRVKHRQWWADFWDRSWIRIHRLGADELVKNGFRDETRDVVNGYVLQRYINACGGRGIHPIKFNGSIFTVDTFRQLDPDYRRWGGCYWFQNTRLIYWPMLASGDFDLMRPLFRMYRDALDLAKARTREYHQHDGAFFPETLYFWGTYSNGEMGYGWNRDGLAPGVAANSYIRHYWSGGLELTTLMLEYHAFTHDETFLADTLLPLARSIVQFYDLHYPRNPEGTIRFAPTQALETWRDCEDPMPIVAGLRIVLNGLLNLPPARTTPVERSSWERLRSELPPIPVRSVEGVSFLAPAAKFDGRQNQENPELYSVFPYRIFGVGKPDLELARKSFQQREFKGTRGWQQDDTQAALLGLTDSARDYVVRRFSDRHPESRFPAFWGPNFDWVPDQSHGGNGLMALQSMLLQWDGNKLLLLPAWPTDWDVDFKLHAPGNTVVQGTVRNGKVAKLQVTPPERAADVIDLSTVQP